MLDEKLWDEYHDRFGEWFPTMCFQTDSPEETNLKMKECLDRGKPAEVVYNLDYSEDILY